MSEQSEAEKAAEESAGCCELMPLFVFDELSGNTDRVQAMARKIAVEFFLRGAAWAAPKWKCPPEYPNEGDLIVVKRHDEGNSFTYHLSRSVRSIPVLSSWMVIEPAAPEVEK